MDSRTVQLSIEEGEELLGQKYPAKACSFLFVGSGSPFHELEDWLSEDWPSRVRSPAGLGGSWPGRGSGWYEVYANLPLRLRRVAPRGVTVPHGPPSERPLKDLQAEPKDLCHPLPWSPSWAGGLESQRNRCLGVPRRGLSYQPVAFSPALFFCGKIYLLCKSQKKT